MHAHRQPYKFENGFTLIELSIVLVIIALIVGGVLAGRELINQAALRRIVSDQEMFDRATNAYRDKFRNVPGDDPQAYNWFGEECGANDTARGTTGLEGCNGNGNGQIRYDTEYEDTKYFEHLSRAGMIPGTYDGNCYIIPMTSTCHIGKPVLSETRNVPSGPGGTMWGLFNIVCNGSGTTAFPCETTSKTYLSLSQDTDAYLVWRDISFEYGNENIYGKLSAVDALSIDGKIDNGLPNVGKVLSTGGSATYDAASCTTGNTADDTYNGAGTDKCLMFFALSGT